MAAKSETSRRVLHPKDQSVSSSAVAPPIIEPKGKRRCVATACIPCRRRKSKCDGGLPKCSTCIAVYKTDCTYDPNSDVAQRKATPLGIKRGSAAVQELTSAEQFVQCLISLPESEAIEAVYQLRANGDVDAITDALRKNVKLSDLSEPPNVESEHAHVKGNAALDQRYRYGFTSGLSLVPGDDEYITTHPQDLPTSQLWTDVTTDSDLVHHLIKLYFTWSNHFYPIVSEEDFYSDFANGRTKACSAILVNAMCAHGSVWTEDPRARDDPEDQRTAGDRFYQRARQLLFKDDVTPRLQTVQALQIMSMREACNGRVSSGFRYAGLALNMGIELGMHLEGWKLGAHEDSMRRRSFWAMFNCDTAWSICAGRVAMLPHAAIEIEKPKATAELAQWQLYNDDYRDVGSRIVRSCLEREMLYQQSSLTELLSELLVIYFAPRERLSSRRILDMYARFQSWYKELPSSMYLSDKSPPNVYMLHMWYWSCVNHLFRPIVRMKLVGSPVQPRKVCIDMAIEISRAMDLYRLHYPMNTVNLLWCHVLLTAGLTHVFDLPSKDQLPSTFTEANLRALKDTAQCLRDFATISSVHRFSVRGIQIICGLADKHGLLLEEDAVREISHILQHKEDALPNIPPLMANPLNDEDTPPHPAQNSSSESSQTPPQPEPARSEVPLPRYEYPDAPQQHNPHTTYQPVNQGHALPPQPAAPQPMDQAPSYPTSFFFTPVDGTIGLPLYHNNPSQSHMDLNVVLGDVDWGEQLRQDGFELSDVWGSDPMAGTNQMIMGRLQQGGQQHPAHGYVEQSQQAYGTGGSYVNNGWS